jgi:hypothetical protein
MRKFFGGLLLAVGVLIAGLSGVCSLMFLGGASGSHDSSLVGVVVMIGGPAIAIGVILIFAGNALLRSNGDQ